MRIPVDPANVARLALDIVTGLGAAIGAPHDHNDDDALITDGMRAAARAFGEVVARELKTMEEEDDG